MDLGFNLPGINPVDRESDSDDPAKNEQLGLNTHLFYRDLAIVRGKIVAIAYDSSHDVIRSLEIFPPNLAGDPTGIVELPNAPNRIAALTGFPVNDGWVTNLYDLAFVTGLDGGISIVDIPKDGKNPTRTGFIPTSDGVITKHIQVDPETQIAYVGASHIGPAHSSHGFLIVDVSKPFDLAQDLN